MNRNLSNELFFDAHRGVDLASPHYPKSGGSSNYVLDTDNIGTHWSVDPSVAKRFAHKGDDPSWRTRHARIVHANIPISSAESDQKVFRERGVDTVGNLGEKEIFVREGAPVQVTGITKLRKSGDTIKSRTRKFKTPRNMTA